MATLKIDILKHHQRRDGTFNVKILLTHQRKKAHIATSIYVQKEQLTKKFDLKDPFLKDELNLKIKKYREIINGMQNIDLYAAKELAVFIQNKASRGESGIDFIDFGRKHVEKLKLQGKKGNARNLQTALNAVVDFFGREKVLIREIDFKFLTAFEAYLKTDRKLLRKNQFGKVSKTTEKPLAGYGLINYLISIRTLFNAARNEFNNEDKGDIVISHYPFKKYRIKKLPAVKKRNLEIDYIRAVRDFNDTGDKKPRGKSDFNRMVLGRDIFMLIFYLLGINTADLFIVEGVKDGRLTYNRKKTKDNTHDESLISIKIPDEALPLLEKYKDPDGKRLFNFYLHYKEQEYFRTAVGKGLKIISETLKFEKKVTPIYARYSFATIARNDCRCSKDDIAMAMNHSDGGHKVTDLYLAVSWDIVDEVQEKVLAKLREAKPVGP